MNETTPALLALLLVACGPAPMPAAPAPPPTASVAPPPTAVPTAEPAPAPPPAPPPAAPFSVVAELPGPFSLYPVEGALLVAEAEVQDDALATYYPGEDLTRPDYKGTRTGRPIGVLENGKVRFPRSLFFGHPSAWNEIVAIGGRWPDGVHMLATSTNGRTGIADRYVLVDRGWQQKRYGAVGRIYTGMARTSGALFALDRVTYPWPSATGSVVALDVEAPPRWLARGTDKACLREDGKTPWLPYAVYSTAFGGTRDGTLVSVGATCDSNWAAEVWRPGAARSSIQVIPGLPAGAASASDTAAFVRGAADDAWILDRFAAHFDGAAWKLVDLPPGVSLLRTGAVAPDGALFAIDGDGKLWRLAGGTWAKVPLPNDLGAGDVAVYDGAIYVSAAGALLRYGAPGAPPSARPERAPGNGKPVRRLPKGGSARCPNNLVVLFAFTKVTPDDYDFPLTRKALKGHFEVAGARYVVTKDLGQKFLTAQVPTFEAGQKLAALIEKSLQGAKPQIVCAAPEVVREVKIDLGTGEIVK